VEWLGEGNAASGVPQEEVHSFALAEGCSGSQGGRCAFAETTSRRVVEVRSEETGQNLAVVGETDEPNWFPTRTVQAAAAPVAGARGGSLRLLGAAHEPHLGVLYTENGRGSSTVHGDRQIVQVLDPKTGDLLRTWVLPERKRWSSMCSIGESLYLLARSPEPQIWRFPLPVLSSSRGVRSKSDVQVPQVPDHAGNQGPRASLRKLGGARQASLTAAADDVKLHAR